MKVLVVSKKTNLELHGETIRKRVKAGLIDAQYFKVLETTHDEHYKTLEKLYLVLDQFQIDYSSISRGLYWPDLSSFSAVITVGGDGTVLEASHHILTDKVTLVGIRSAHSSVGKLCYTNSHKTEDCVRALAEGSLNTLQVSRLQAQISSAESANKTTTTQPVLNDFLYTNIAPAATTRYKLGFSKRIEEHRSSGIWISTPCGSTAAIHAAGAQAQDLNSRSFQFLVRELYDPNGKDSKPIKEGLFDPESNPLQIENLSEKALLACDGLHGAVYLSFGDVIHFLRGPDLKIARPDFYS